MIRIVHVKLARPVMGFARTVGQTRSVRHIVRTVTFRTIVVGDGSTTVTYMTHLPFPQTVVVRD